MSYDTINQQIMDLEQKIQAATNTVAELERKILEHRVGLSFNAVGKTDVIYEYEIDMENVIKEQMSMKQKLSALYKQFPTR